MKKFKWFVFTNTILLLIATLINVTRIDQISKENAKTKLEQAIKEVPIEEDIADVAVVKDKIISDIPNSKIVNENSNKFPVYTVVDGYDFKVEEDGTVGDAEEIIKNEEMVNDDNKNEIEENDKQEENTDNIVEEKQTIVKYSDDIKTDKGITIATTTNGIVTINGKSMEKLFIKISNNINITDNIINDFETWKDENVLLNKGLKIEEKISELENIPAKGELNVVLRTENNEAFGIIKTIDGATTWTGKLDKNIMANYIYIDKGVEINNMKFKVEITEEKEDINNKVDIDDLNNIS